MTKSDGSKYQAPRGVRLSDAANARGDSCYNGNSDTSCGDGGAASPYCINNGNAAYGCRTGATPAIAACAGTGSNPHGCGDGNTVIIG